MTATFEITAGLNNDAGAHLAQALGMDSHEMFNGWMRNLTTALEQARDTALTEADRGSYLEAMDEAGGSHQEWEAA